MKAILSFDDMAWSNDVPETVALYDAGTTYAALDTARDPVTNHIFESQQAGNTGNALSDGAWWVDLGPSNKTAVFDEKVGTITSQDDAISISGVSTGRMAALAFFNVDATSIDVTVTDATDGVLYNESHPMVTHDNVANIYDYGFAPLIQKTELPIVGLPLYVGATIDITINKPGGIARIGNVVGGELIDLGPTRYGFGVGINDYSQIKRDDFGIAGLTQRDYSRLGSFVTEPPRGMFDYVARFLTERRAKPTVFMGVPGFGATMIYGIPASWRERLNYYHNAELVIELEGLN